jgi:diguanylate cyclase (GGDEF)-like protein/PAS domain S-box-containing protein
VFVVDDDLTVQLMAREAFEQIGFTVAEALSGEEALSAFERFRPNIVLLDVFMPGVDGFEVCAAIRNMPDGKHLPILMVTGADDVDSINRAYEVGATDFITKPINWLILKERVRYMLRASQALEQLHKSEARLAKAQRIAHLGSWELNVEKNEFDYSEEVARIYGLRSLGAKVGYEEFLNATHPDDRDSVAKLINQAISKGKSFELDHRIILIDKTERIVFQRVEVILDGAAKVAQVVGTVQNITERKQTELFEIDRNRVLEMIVNNEALPDIMTQIAHMVERQRPDGLCSLSLVHGDRLYVKAAPGLPSLLIQALDGQEIGTGAGCCSSAAYFGHTVTASEIATSPHWEKNRDLALSHDLRACTSIPIFSGKGQIFGTVALYHRTSYRPVEADLKLLETVSKLGAVAIEQTHLTEQLAHQARHDALTGLPNRRFIADHLEREFARALRHGDKIALLYIDLDRFKQVNDSLGHQIGDFLLEKVAKRLRVCTRESDILARMGGDEFMLVLNGINDRENASKAASRVLNLLEAPFEVEDHDLHIGASIGISVYPNDGQDLATIQKNADIAMYHAKNRGGNQFHYFTPKMKEIVIERLELENELRKALERKDFELYYQPQYDLTTGSLVGVEALLRWQHSELGSVPPSKFIPIAEQSGLIIPIGKWVLQEACRQNAAWQRAGYGSFKVAVNISAVQFLQADFVDLVMDTLKQSNLAPQWLQLEVTETTMMKDIETTTKLLAELQTLGVSIAMDDFGTGYASMAQLQRLPVDCLKIDGIFIHEIEGSEESAQRSRAMIKTFVSLAQNLGLKIIAECVETWRQHEFLHRIGCEFGQGFLYKEPVSGEEIESHYEQQERLDLPKKTSVIS